MQVGVHALIYLLAKGKTEDSSLYAKEVISGDSAVVARLLDDVRSSSGTTEPLPTLGLELLVHFIHAQADGDFFQHIEDLIPRVYALVSLPSTIMRLRHLCISCLCCYRPRSAPPSDLQPSGLAEGPL